MTGRDYNVCPENADGQHGPLRDHMDPEIDLGFVSVCCAACGTSTGYEIARFADDLEWN